MNTNNKKFKSSAGTDSVPYSEQETSVSNPKDQDTREDVLPEKVRLEFLYKQFNSLSKRALSHFRPENRPMIAKDEKADRLKLQKFINDLKTNGDTDLVSKFVDHYKKTQARYKAAPDVNNNEKPEKPSP